MKKLTTYIFEVLHPIKSYNNKISEFNKKFKKPYATRTNIEKIICDAYFYINFSGKNNLRYYGALEAALIIENYISVGETNFYKTEGYMKKITEITEKYLTDKNLI